MPLNLRSVYPVDNPDFVFASRRSTVHSTQGMVSCTQPLAARCGIKILDAGGNAADASVAVAAGLAVTEPTSTGIGGDMFCLFYNAKTKEIAAMNGSGRASAKSTLEAVRKNLGLKDGEAGNIPETSVHAVTVPGAAAGWVDTIERFGSGKLTMEQILAPAIELAEIGFPVSDISSNMWRAFERFLLPASPNYSELLKKTPDGFRGPNPGELFRNKPLATTFRALAKEGKKGFYTGRIAEAIIKVTKDRGGFLELEDLEYHLEKGSEPVDPISYVFKGQGYVKTHGDFVDGSSGQGTNEDNHGLEIWEHPPNGQGIVALMALGIFEALEEAGKIPHFTPSQHNSTQYLHAAIESLRIAFADASWWIADTAHSKVPSSTLISRPYLAERAKLFDPLKASSKIYDRGSPAHNHSDTVYFAVTDKEGNGMSFINSIFDSFGSGIIPEGTGFVLQNRGAGFQLKEGHPNVIAPRKRPYHTIIPAMVTNVHDGSLHSVYGVMGGFMQPQGHVQVLLNMIAFKHNPQAALDAPRFCIGAEYIPGDPHERSVYLEEGISESVCQELKDMGHDAKIVTGYKRRLFGRGQIIRAHVEDGVTVYSAGSDPRGDGAAFPG
ncbi:putative gamma-glutamyltransferase ywrD [Hyaloscypha variabilis F]|uniref:Putative gamma-glutamyltransferase ywrD n=1 Tax=Hyaloscypha variabilis (strain UAMH 11265 / GT02V1 / F) TaxID=1149755 RepID=A0A2J6S0P3_HYAVF|nr:putative gamma-glutamyltransferase ywrD [Hyaloscypha variabilis F]